MAWTAPMTAVANSAFTAAQFNAHVRDNLNETAPAKATTVSGYFVATGANSIAERVPQISGVGSSETTTSTSYTDLTTPGPDVTVTTGARALYIITSRQKNSVDNGATFTALDISGASSIPASDNRALLTDGLTADNELRMSVVQLEAGLTPGSNVFTMKYRVSGGTGTYQNRHLIVLPY